MGLESDFGGGSLGAWASADAIELWEDARPCGAALDMLQRGVVGAGA